MSDERSVMLKRLWRETKATALVEFAIALPVLASFFIGSYVVTDEIACARKNEVAARTLADLLSRGFSPTAIVSNVSGTDATGTMLASVLTLAPYNVSHATENVALLRVCDSTHAYVIWSQAVTQTSAGVATAATPLLQAGTLSAASVISVPSNMITAPMVPTSPDGSNVCKNYNASTDQTTQVGTAGSFLFVSQVDYTYVVPIGFDISTNSSLSSHLYMLPRLQ